MDDEQKLATYVSNGQEITGKLNNGNNSDDSKRTVYSGESIRVKFDVFLESLSNIDSVNQTFRSKLHAYIYRGFSPHEKELYESLDDKSGFIPQCELLLEPGVTYEVIRYERALFNNGKTYFVAYDPTYDEMSVVYHFIMDCVFLEDLELKNFPFDIQHFEIGLSIDCQLLSDSLGFYPYSTDIGKVRVGMPGNIFNVIGWKFIGNEFRVYSESWGNEEYKQNRFSNSLAYTNSMTQDNLTVDENTFWKNYNKFNPTNKVYSSKSDGDVKSGTTKNLCIAHHGSGTSLVFRIKFQRQWQFFFSRVILVLGILSFLSLFCFTFGSDSIPDRFSFVSTILLAAVAYMFIIIAFIPALNYLTLLDKYVYFTFLFLLFIGVENGVLSILLQLFDDYFEDDDSLLFIDFLLLIVNLVLWILAHLYFYFQALAAYDEECKKINMTKEMIEEMKPKDERYIDPTLGGVKSLDHLLKDEHYTIFNKQGPATEMIFMKHVLKTE